MEDDQEEGVGRRPWEEVWRSGDNIGYEEFTKGLPSFTRPKSELVRCSLNHIDRYEDELAVTWHAMRYITTQCSSARCKSSGEVCLCRYKILECQEANFKLIYEQGSHTMDDNAPPSPIPSKLTQEMKGFLETKLNDSPSLVAQSLYAFLCREINDQRISGPAPGLAQVQNYQKGWRRKNRPDSMEPVLEICRRCMYDRVQSEQRTPESLIVLCDTRTVDGMVEPALGTRSEGNPFRIGLTCMSLLERYVDVQLNPLLTTLLHCDTTHDCVKQKYPVSVVGISDRSGGFLPIVYCRTSQRRALDISWFLAVLKRVILREFDVSFSPDFVMMDADKATFNACVRELPETITLMCWFHVMQNVLKHCREAKLPSISIQLIFRNLYDLHFSPDEEHYERKRAFVLSSWRGAGVICPRFRRAANHFISLWISGPRFTRWQAYLTPTGYVATNNPLETYHRVLKLVNDSKRVNPVDLDSRLDLSRIANLSSMQAFDDRPTVSKRMLAAYRRVNKYKEFVAEVVHRLPNQDLVLVRVAPPTNAFVENVEGNDNAQASPCTYESANYTRIMWQGMPVGGWIVDATNRACMCLPWKKAGICMHIIKATTVVGLPCPGVPAPQLRFERPRLQDRTRAEAARSSLSVDQNLSDAPSQDAVSFGPNSLVDSLSSGPNLMNAVVLTVALDREVEPGEAATIAHRESQTARDAGASTVSHSDQPIQENLLDTASQPQRAVTDRSARRSSRQRVPTRRAREAYVQVQARKRARM